MLIISAPIKFKLDEEIEHTQILILQQIRNDSLHEKTQEKNYLNYTFLSKGSNLIS